jgi:hypothetical protein
MSRRTNEQVHQVDYWAEPFEQPAWRAAWVEPIPPG